MTRIIMNGCCGRMGRVISDLVKNDKDAEIVAGVDIVSADMGYPVFTDINLCDVEADVIIDFSNPAGLENLLQFAEKKSIPVVLCSTGFSAEQLDYIREKSKTVAILKSANMSLGINAIIKLLKEASNIFVPAGYDVEIVEQHHNQKLDAPSGTALALADSINEEYDNSFEYVYDRSTKREKRTNKEIGISAVRGGTIVGDHDVIFAGTDEVITFSHSAYSKSVFAKGAVEAAKFLAGKGPGFYDVKDVIAAK